jgi:hypothetical protein
MDDQLIAQVHREMMDRTPLSKTWTVESHDNQGPAIMTMRMPDITITDAEGRHIVLTAKQCAVLGSYMTDTLEWIEGFGD